MLRIKRDNGVLMRGKKREGVSVRRKGRGEGHFKILNLQKLEGGVERKKEGLPKEKDLFLQ